MNNIKNEFIAYEQALELKELGFDEPCLMYYDYSWTLVESGVYECKAPLIQQAFRWLLVLVNKDKHFTNKWTISYNEDYYSLFLGGCNMEVFKAELDCIKYLIEIVKEK
jgi:hypothetical protein